MTHESRFQFSRFDELMLLKFLITYLLDIALTINTIINVYKNDAHLKELYLCCFIIPNILAGIKSLHWYWIHYRRDDLTEEETEKEEKTRTWVFRLLFFFFSPIPRFIDVYRLGLQERYKVQGRCSQEEARAAYKEYLEAATTLCLLRFFEVFLMDAPMLTLKFHVLIKDVRTQINFSDQIYAVILIVYKLYKVSDIMMSYTTKTKKWWHMENEAEYELSPIESVKRGTIDLPGKLCLIALHCSQIACKCLCYAMVTSAYLPWLIYPLVGLRWTANSCIYFFNRNFRRFGSPGEEISRTLTAVVIGGIELFTHFTTSAEKRQLGNTILFHVLDGFEVLIAFFLPYFGTAPPAIPAPVNGTLTTTATSGGIPSVTGTSVTPTTALSTPMWPISVTEHLTDPKYILVALWISAMMIRAFYYVILHPSLPSLSEYFPFCSRKARAGVRGQAEERVQAEEEIALDERV
ncbi:uncharacterized protein LOC125027378 [Penaeus chinensis]|uniref:uncharacterized protein LOC125027378 n=1 Tax=Penaeus chinensis TaxID=139456 RepID=UPI001FB827F0|nr:uncharacterized protein LOC125027378 [Penaeus chinensis]